MESRIVRGMVVAIGGSRSARGLKKEENDPDIEFIGVV